MCCWGPIARRLQELLGRDIVLSRELIGPAAQEVVDALEDGDVLLLENIRFDKREKKNDPEFARALADLADAYVNDAFGTAHRAQASTAGVADFLPSYAGYLMEREVATLTGMLDEPRRPFVAILGGSKVSDKIKVIDALLEKADTLIIGGGMCFTFLAAQGKSVGTSLMEADWVERAGAMMKKAADRGVALLLPVDVVCADAFANDANLATVSVDEIPDDMMGLDIGPETAELYAEAIGMAKSVFWNGPMGVFEMPSFEAGTRAPDDMMGLDIGPETAELYAEAIGMAKSVFWNGPMGVFEMPSFEAGTRAVAEAVAANEEADTIIGGGDSVAAVNQFDLADKMTFISTGGGASMELVQGEALPGVEALR